MERTYYGVQIERALDLLEMECRSDGLQLAHDDRAARAAEALAIYIRDSKP